MTLLVQWGLNLGHFIQEITENHCNLPLCGYPPLLTLRPYISACDGDKKHSKIQLAVHCGAGSLIAINSYRRIANC